jgi:hypothetical protein
MRSGGHGVEAIGMRMPVLGFTRACARRFGPLVLGLLLVSLGTGTSQALAGTGERTTASVQPKAHMPVFEIDGFVLRDVGPYSGIGAIQAVPCEKMGDDCSTAPSGAAVADAIWNTGTLTYANAPMTDPPQRYQLINDAHVRTLLLGDGMPMDRRIIDQAARAGYEAIMVNWEHPDDPSLKHPIGSLRAASQWTRHDGMKFGVALGGKIMLEICPNLGYSHCPTVPSPIQLIHELERETPLLDELLRDTDMFTFELQWEVMIDQARYASENLDIATFMHRRALKIGAKQFIYLAEMTTMNSNDSLKPSDYPSAAQYLESWRGISGHVGPSSSHPIQGLFLLVNGLACANPKASDPAKRDCHGNPNPGTDDRVVQMARFLRTAFTVPA